jgi:alpha-2-macroglobulin
VLLTFHLRKRNCMKARLLLAIVTGIFLWTIAPGAAQQQARIESFSPTGTVKQIRQVQVRFSEPMVPFGDLRDVAQPFNIACSESGKARWVDDRNWAYDFDHDLPAGVRCTFQARDGLRSLAGIEIAGTRSFSFSTGGPAILESNPYEGAEYIGEDQIFILKLDSDVTEASVLQNVYFAVEGIANRIAVRIVSGSDREKILKEEYRYLKELPPHLLLIQAKQKFPDKTRITLVWGRGVQTPGGVATEQDQALPFVTIGPFRATFHCQRENPKANCIPISPMLIRFSAPVPTSVVKKIVLKGSDGRQYQADAGGESDEERVVQFKGPFPERSTFTIELPSGIKDDAGRPLTNANKYPLTVKTDEYPPLAKFAAPFGIIELKGNPLLPVTLRNVEPTVAGRMMEVREGQENIDPPRELALGTNEQVQSKIQGKIYRVPANTANEMLFWIDKVENQSEWWNSSSEEKRDKSVFGSVTGARTQSFTVPKLQGPKSFEVVGIPLKSPGFYVVELESELLGASLLGKSKPMYVPTTALVTNLSAHFKRGIESSLVWVTALDDAKPVPHADVQIRDCEGTLRWKGTTDRDGIARAGKLPSLDELPRCSSDSLDSGLVISAQVGEDMTFVHTSWTEGIESWRFQLPTEWDPTLDVVHTVFDRPLFRAGETVHMKHILRKRALEGFAPFPKSEIGESVEIHHMGIYETGGSPEYEAPLKWNADGSAESTWIIPKGAKLGSYEVFFKAAKAKTPPYGGMPYWPRINAGYFGVGEFRVPLMKAFLRPPAQELISPSSVPIDMTVTYLAGGGAGQLPVKFRYMLEPRSVTPSSAYDGFIFSNGRVHEGLVRNGSEYEGDEGEEDEPRGVRRKHPIKSQDLTLDSSGSARTHITGLPKMEEPMSVLTELDFKDPNGEVQTVSTRIPLWPAARIIGLKPDSWALSRNSLKFQALVLDLKAKPIADAPVNVTLFERKTYSHRKRLVGGFYAYEHSTEIRKVQAVCAGKTDKRGLLLCDSPVSISGNLILEAVTSDAAGHEAAVNQSVWVAGSRDWWFNETDSDRMDLLPEAKRYEPGETARFQVRMPFRNATALITVEREGVGESFIRELSGKEPVFELPVKGNWAPNVFISVLAVRGRVNDVQPTATVDLGRPAFRLGITEIQVGWKAHELKVNVSTDRSVYKVRAKAQAKIAVATADGRPLPPGSEVAVAAVDEGLLELKSNESWDLLKGMMGQRAYGVQTSTAQMNVIGKRHFGLKALPQGGGGGKGLTRELFDTLLLWKGRVKLDARGEALVELPLNDSLTSFRIAAIATGGLDRFGFGTTSIRTTQDLLLFSGIPPIVRQGDTFLSTFTVRNATERPMKVTVSARIQPAAGSPQPQEISLGSGESREIRWNLTAPIGTETLKYEIEASADGSASDRLTVTQKVIPAVPVRTLQSTLTQIEKSYAMTVERPGDAISGLGGMRVALQPRLVDGLTGVADYMKLYPYTCLEQVISKAVALRDDALWNRTMESLPVYLDSDGLAKFFPSMNQGNDTLTSYVLSIADEAGLKIPDASKGRMLAGLQGFVEGRVVRYASLPTADLAMRKLAAIEAMSRAGKASPNHLSSIAIAPNLWPTSTVIDWLNILSRMTDYRERSMRLPEAQQILRSRLNLQGTTMGFSTARSDALWWLMISVDSNAVRLLLSELGNPEWKQDIPRLVRGVLGRQAYGHWDTTVANAWGVLAMEKFSKAFENTPVTGQTTASLAGQTQVVDWQALPKGKALSFLWPVQRSSLDLTMKGAGSPWATIQSLAAVPLRTPLSSGFKITKTLTPMSQKEKGNWNIGDVLRVKIEIESQGDMTWVVVNDPIPAGSAIFGTGLGHDSEMAAKGEKNTGWAWPDFEERSFEAYRAYYEFVAKGTWSLEYTLRLNNTGVFQLPPTRVEAMYAPEMFGELPNPSIQVK